MKRLFLTAMLLFLAGSSLAGAEPKKVDPVFRVQGGVLQASFRLPGVLDEELRERVNSGLTNRILLTAWLESSDGKWKGGETILSLQAVYDVWEETYIIQRQDVRGASKKVFREQTAFVSELTKVDNLPLLQPQQLDQSKKYILRVVVSVNPPSKELVEKAKEYLSDPEGTKRLSTSRTVFGSFARTFIPSAIGESGQVHEYASMPFTPASLGIQKEGAR
jgi:hypothetical protein